MTKNERSQLDLFDYLSAEDFDSPHWIPLVRSGAFKCSNCFRATRDDYFLPRLYWNYCPFCGLRME